MRAGMHVSHDPEFAITLRRIEDLERAGLDLVVVPEAYGFDAISQLGAIAARTTTVEIACGIIPIFTRTPALIAMTAAGLDFVSDGRFTLGLGASGPELIEGFHGVAYDRPLARTREIIEICRTVWQRTPLRHSGAFEIPRMGVQGQDRRALRLTVTPPRPSIPVFIAAIGPKNVALAAEVAEGWEPTLYIPEKAHDVWGDALELGAAKRDPSLGPLDVIAHVYCAITADSEPALDFLRSTIALYVGGMGPKGQNFYNELVCRYGFESEAATVQELYLSGEKQAAQAALPIELLEGISLIGDVGYIRERLSVFKEAGVSTLNIAPVTGSHQDTLSLVEKIRSIIEDLP